MTGRRTTYRLDAPIQASRDETVTTTFVYRLDGAHEMIFVKPDGETAVAPLVETFDVEISDDTYQYILGLYEEA